MRLHIWLTYYPSGHQTTQSFTLDCAPVGGTLPLAARVCTDIARHREAMLNPRAPRSQCLGSQMIPQLVIDTNNKGAQTSFGGSPWCGWPGGTPLAIYFAASQRDTTMLARAEPLLRCEDDPDLFVKPTPYASVVACTHGLWTPASERDIATAERAPQLAPLRPATIFPRDIGAIRCRIPAGGPVSRALAGVCGVRLTGPPSSKLVHFVETWSQGQHIFRHRWTIKGSTLLSQRGPVPPQLWR
jgi:hypothetical protein